MRKFCYITTIAGTLKAFVLETAKELYKTGEVDITFICDYDEKFEKELPPYIHYIPVPMKRGISLSAFKAIKSLKKIFKEQQFDYIQYSTPNASFYSSIAAKSVKAPIRLYAQWGIRYVGNNGIKRKILKFLEKKTCKNSNYIRSVSPKNMEFGISEGLYSADKVKVIGNGGTIGVDMSVFDISVKNEKRAELRNQYNIHENTFVFGFVGRVSRDKGTEELLSAFKKVCEKGYDAKLMMIGNSENLNGVNPKVFGWAKECDKVIFTGRIDNKELPAYYGMFDCYVHPTYREGFGMVLQESGAMGTAIITTDIPGAGEVMENGVSCLLVQPKSVESLYDAMEKLIKNPEIAEEIGNEAYERTKALYERSIMIGNIKQDTMSFFEKGEKSYEVNVGNL